MLSPTKARHTTVLDFPMSFPFGLAIVFLFRISILCREKYYFYSQYCCYCHLLFFALLTFYEAQKRNYIGRCWWRSKYHGQRATMCELGNTLHAFLQGFSYGRFLWAPKGCVCAKRSNFARPLGHGRRGTRATFCGLECQQYCWTSMPKPSLSSVPGSIRFAEHPSLLT